MDERARVPREPESTPERAQARSALPGHGSIALSDAFHLSPRDALGTGHRPMADRVLSLQRATGNATTVAALGLAGQVQMARSDVQPQPVAGALAPSGDAPGLRVQRNIGVEIELTRSGREGGMAFGPAGVDQAAATTWRKRDIVADFGTWDLTLDDTPGITPRDANGESKDTGAHQMFHLEFNLHGEEANTGSPMVTSGVWGTPSSPSTPHHACR